VAIQITNPNSNLNPHRDTGKTCLGSGVHCPTASSFLCFFIQVFDCVVQVFAGRSRKDEASPLVGGQCFRFLSVSAWTLGLVTVRASGS